MKEPAGPTRSRKGEAIDCASWVRRVNGRWIVHEGMRASASDYLAYLESTDPDRFARSCRLARRLAEEQGVLEDPKPWFYAGLFSLASVTEAERFLTGHAFTRAVIPAGAGQTPAALSEETVAEATWAKICRIRKKVAEVAEER